MDWRAKGIYAKNEGGQALTTVTATAFVVP